MTDKSCYCSHSLFSLIFLMIYHHSGGWVCNVPDLSAWNEGRGWTLSSVVDWVRDGKIHVGRRGSTVPFLFDSELRQSLFSFFTKSFWTWSALMSFQRAPSIEVLRFLHLSPFLFPAFSTSLWLCPHLSPFLLRSVLQKETAKVRRSNFFLKNMYGLISLLAGTLVAVFQCYCSTFG